MLDLAAKELGKIDDFKTTYEKLFAI